MDLTATIDAASVIREFIESQAFAENSDRVAGILRSRYTGMDEDEARDCIQEAVLNALKSADRFDPKRDPRAWLCVLALNVACTRARRRAGHPTDSLEALLDAGWEPCSNRIGGLSAVEQDDLVRWLHEWVGSLTDKQQVAVELHIFRRMTALEISELLDETEQAVQDRITDGMTRFRDSLRARPEFADLRLPTEPARGRPRRNG